MLEGAQERVGVVQGPAVLAPDVAALGEARQRAQRRRRAHLLVGAAVHHLQQLDGELDVAQAAGPELELSLGVVGGDVVEHPATHRLHLVDEAVALGRRPDQRADHLDVLPAERQVAGHRPRLEQGLELPRLRPALVVAAVAGEGAHQRARLALGAQVGVDRPDRALAGVVRADLHHRRGQLGGGAHGRLLVVALRRLGHEDHVDVADVVELVAPALAHRDHGEPARATRTPPPWRGPRPARRPGCRRPGRRARPRRRRHRGGGSGRGRRGAAAGGGTPRAGRPAPRAAAGWRRAAASSGSAPTARSSDSRSAYAGGRVEPSVGSHSSCQWSGWRRRWSPSAWLAPSTESSRIEVPSSSATSCSSPSRSSTASASATRAASAWSGSALRPSSGTIGAATSPSFPSRVPARSGSRNPSRTSLPWVMSPRDATRRIYRRATVPVSGAEDRPAG